MSLLSPLSLIWLLPLGGAIVVLYLLKLKRKERTVSSVMLWQSHPAHDDDIRVIRGDIRAIRVSKDL